MVAVLGAFRQAVHRYDALADVARHLDSVISQISGDEDFVTAVLVEIGGASVTVVNCGHHPPVLVDRTAVRFLTYGFGDQRLLLYTDGLVEARRAKGDAFFALGEHAPVLGSGDAEAGLATLVNRLMRHTGGHVDDDIAMVLISRG